MARHAHATTATVWVRVSPAEVTVEVCDDGRGLSGMPKGAAAAERAAPHSTGGRVFPDSSGLVNLAARARARGGTSGLSHGAGTTLRWSVPLPASPAPDPEGRA